ncbi:MAG: DUF4037 domain-containing protein [Nanoarchaeota archaeon]
MITTPQLIANAFKEIPEVVAVSIAGSNATGCADMKSDLDLYVYSQHGIPLPARSEIARNRSDLIEIDNDFWEPGDAWIERESGLLVEVTYRTTRWIEDQLDRILKRHEASLGYSTCLWHSVRSSKSIFDRNGWYQELLKLAKGSYPEALRNAIIQKNLPVLRKLSSSYLYQIELAIARDDFVSVNHRVTALLASYFDILFAINRIPHPGEKRQVQFVNKFCTFIPDRMEENVRQVLQLRPTTLVSDINDLLNELDDLLRKER